MSGRPHSTGLLDTGLTATNLVSLGEFLDIMAVSCDSFNEETNRLIGRHQHGKDHLRCLENVRDWCRKYHVAFKINTVVNTYNVGEDMRENITRLAPIRWKVLAALYLGLFDYTVAREHAWILGPNM